MSVEVRSKEIEGFTYELTLFGAKQGQRVWLRLAKCLGPAAVEILSQGSAGVGPAVAAFLGGIGEDDLDFLTGQFAGSCKLVLIMTTAAGPKPNPQPLSNLYDQHFARRYPALIAWFTWAVSENYASFFDASALLGALSAVIPKLSGYLSRAALTGSSGESLQTDESTSA
jgi:hypothetical protein